MACVSWCNFTGTVRPPKEPESQLVVWEVGLALFSDYAWNQMLRAWDDGADAPERPGVFYIHPTTTINSGANPGTLFTGTGFTRPSIYFTRVTDIQRWNPVDVYSPVAPVQWDGIFGFALFDAPTAGNYWGYGNLVSELVVPVQKQILWPAQAVSVARGSPSF